MTAELLHFRELGRTIGASSKLTDVILQFPQISDLASRTHSVDGSCQFCESVSSGKPCNGCVTLHDRQEVVPTKASVPSTSFTSLTQRFAGFDRFQYNMLPSGFEDTVGSCHPVAVGSIYATKGNLVNSVANVKVSVLLPAMLGGDQEWQTLSNFISGGHNDSYWDEIYRPCPLICVVGDSATNNNKFHEDLRGICLGSTESIKPGWKANSIWNAPVSRLATTKEDYNKSSFAASKALTTIDSAASHHPADPTYIYPEVKVSQSSSSGIYLLPSMSVPSTNSTDYSGESSNDPGLLRFPTAGRKRSSFDDSYNEKVCESINFRRLLSEFSTGKETKRLCGASDHYSNQMNVNECVMSGYRSLPDESFDHSVAANCNRVDKTGCTPVSVNPDMPPTSLSGHYVTYPTTLHRTHDWRYNSAAAYGPSNEGPMDVEVPVRITTLGSNFFSTSKALISRCDTTDSCQDVDEDCFLRYCESAVAYNEREKSSNNRLTLQKVCG